MACKDCFRNCPQKITDLCVEYTGEDIPELDICNGDTLSFVEANIIEKLISALNGTGITIEDFVNCSTIETLLDGADVNAATLLQALVTNACAVEEAINEINAKLNTPFTVNAPCLNLAADATRDDILKAAAVKVCDVSTKVDEVFTDYVKASELCDKVQVCIDTINNGGGTTVVQEFTKMAKYVPQLYLGPLTVFDSSGKGIASQGYDKVYQMNGMNGMPDWRGRVGIGANTGVVGGTLDVAVDPAQIQNAGYSLTQGSKKGTYTDTLNNTQIPAHNHNIPDQTVNLKLPGQRGGDNSDNNNTTAFSGGDKLPGDTGFNFTLTVPTVIPAHTTSSTGGGQPHNTLPPSAVGVWIIYWPQ